MQAIHNSALGDVWSLWLFQRAKIQDKCKQFTTRRAFGTGGLWLFQRAKIQDKCKQFTTKIYYFPADYLLFQRAKIQDKCKQFTTSGVLDDFVGCCFKEQRYKINASNSQPTMRNSLLTLGCFKEQRYKINASNSQPGV